MTAPVSTTTRNPLLKAITESRNFRALWMGQSFSRLGDSIMLTALPILAYSTNHSPLYMSLLLVCLSLPQLFLLPFAGVLADRLPRVRLLVLSDSIRCMLVIGLCLLVILHVVGFVALASFEFLTGAMDSLFMPAYSALQAEIFTDDIRNSANALTQFTEQGARLLGPVLGGVLLTLTSSAANLGLDAVTFLLSIFSLRFVKGLSTARTTTRATPSIWIDLKAGIAAVAKTPWISISMLAMMLLSIGYASFDSILLPWLVKVDLHDPASVFGYVMTSNGLGMLAASLLFGMRQRWRRRGITAYGSIALTGIAVVLTGITSFVPALLLLSFIAGFGVIFFNITWQTTLQELVPLELFGRISSVDMILSVAMLPLGYAAIGFLASILGGRVMIFVCGLILIATAAFVLTLRTIRRFD